MVDLAERIKKAKKKLRLMRRGSVRWIDQDRRIKRWEAKLNDQQSKDDG